jgi:acyl-CoA hydrolase
MTDRAKTPSESRTELAELMMPNHANVMGKAFGGVVLGLIDKAAGAAAIRHSGRICVTAEFDKVTFHGPIEIGELVRIVATVNAVGRTSMEIGVDVRALNVRTGESRRTNTCHVTMVALDDTGRPTPVPPLAPETPAEKRLEAEARERMRARKDARKASGAL